jgi:large subunit ribosomal protein L25
MSKIAFDFSKPIEVLSRVEFGTYAAKKQKNNNYVLASIYENGKSIHFSIDSKTANKIINIPTAKTKIINISLDGKNHKVMIKKVTLHPVKDEAQYIEFISCEGKNEVEVLVPLAITGRSVCPGLKKSGKLNIVKYEIPLICDITKIPEMVSVDISTFGLGRTYNSDQIKIDGARVKSKFAILSIIGRGKKDASDDQAKDSGESKEATKPSASK